LVGYYQKVQTTTFGKEVEKFELLHNIMGLSNGTSVMEIKNRMNISSRNLTSGCLSKRNKISRKNQAEGCTQ
jgi:hypothetical protein